MFVLPIVLWRAAHAHQVSWLSQILSAITMCLYFNKCLSKYAECAFLLLNKSCLFAIQDIKLKSQWQSYHKAYSNTEHACIYSTTCIKFSCHGVPNWTRKRLDWISWNFISLLCHVFLCFCFFCSMAKQDLLGRLV